MWTVLWRLDNNKYSLLLATLNTDIIQNIIDLGCISQFVYFSFRSSPYHVKLNRNIWILC